MSSRTLQVIIEQDEDGIFVAEIPGIKACYAQGDTFEEAWANIRDVLELCLAEMKKRGEPLAAQNEIIGVKRLRVTV